jgi:large subunit ribosomal protein L28
MVSLASEKLEKSFKLKVSASALRTVDKKGGLDLYLLSADETLLSRNALKIKKDIETLEEVKEK